MIAYNLTIEQKTVLVATDRITRELGYRYTLVEDIIFEVSNTLPNVLHTFIEDYELAKSQGFSEAIQDVVDSLIASNMLDRTTGKVLSNRYKFVYVLEKVDPQMKTIMEVLEEVIKKWKEKK